MTNPYDAEVVDDALRPRSPFAVTRWLLWSTGLGIAVAIISPIPAHFPEWNLIVNPVVGVLQFVSILAFAVAAAIAAGRRHSRIPAAKLATFVNLPLWCIAFISIVTFWPEGLRDIGKLALTLVVIAAGVGTLAVITSYLSGGGERVPGPVSPGVDKRNGDHAGISPSLTPATNDERNQHADHN